MKRKEIKMAKVITCQSSANSNGTVIKYVATVNPIMNRKMAEQLFGLPLATYEETPTMPLPFALECAAAKRKKLGLSA